MAQTNDLAQQVWALWNGLLKRRTPWQPTWDEIARHEFPRRTFHLGIRSEGEDQTDDMFDSTAARAGGVLAAALQSGLSNQAIKWFNLILTDAGLMQDDEVKLWLEDTNERMLKAFAASNFGTESSELYLDLAFFGIAPVLVEEAQGPTVSNEPANNFKGLRFEALPIGSYVVDEDAFGKVNTVVRRVVLSPAAILSKWTPDQLSEPTREAIEKKPESEIAFIHAVIDKKRFRPAPNITHPIASIWMEEKKKHVVSVGGYHEFPYAVPRWNKASGEAYGRGPGHTALPDVKTLNKLIELNLKALAVAVNPPVKARQNSVIGSVELGEGGLTIVRNMDDLAEFITRPNFQASTLEVQDLRESINETFFVKHLLQLLSRDTPMMTATEVTAKMQLLREIIGPAFARLEDEYLNPVIDRAFALMHRAGAFTDEPVLLAGEKINVNYESPIGLAKRGQELIAIDRVMLRAQELAVLGKVDALDNINSDEILRITAEVAGAPKRILTTAEERDLIRQAREKSEAEAETLQGTLAASEAAKNLAPLAKVVQGAEPPER